MTTPRWLGHAARHASDRPWTLGAVLDEYCSSERLTREGLASLLGCSVESLAWLSLCKRPTAEHFALDVARIAERFQIEPARLARVVRRVDTLAVLRQPSDVAEEDLLLLAARDRNEEKDK